MATERQPEPDNATLETGPAARFRAAFAFAGYAGPQEISDALGISRRTASRYERGEPLKGGGSRYTSELWDAVVKLTGVPRWFLEQGWQGAPLPDEETIAEKVEALSNQMDALFGILGGHITKSIRREADEQREDREDPEGEDAPGH